MEVKDFFSSATATGFWSSLDLNLRGHSPGLLVFLFHHPLPFSFPRTPQGAPSKPSPHEKSEWHWVGARWVPGISPTLDNSYREEAL